MKTPQGPSLFSKQTSINTYIVQTSPGTPTPVCWTQWLDCGLSRKTHHCRFVQKRSSLGWKYITSVQYTVPCGLCGWKYITSVQYTVQYSTLQYSTQYSTCGWKYITSVQYSTKLFCLEKKQPNFEKFLQVQIPHTHSSDVWVQKRSSNLANPFKTSDDLSS